MNETGFEILECNGTDDHLHLLISFDSVKSISEIVKQIKGTSSRFINKISNSAAIHFEWQEGYAVFTVSPNQILSVLGYIQNQEKHHRKKNFEDELEVFQKLSESSE